MQQVIGLMPKSPLRKAKEKLWKLVSIYVRTKDADDNGYVACYTCGNIDHWKGMQAGHGIGGRKNAVLYDLEVLRPQCPGCNMMGRNGEQYIFGRKLNEENGEGWFEQRLIDAKKPKKFTIPDIEDMTEAIREMTDGQYR